MNHEWYLRHDGEHSGPYRSNELRRMVSRGEASDTDQVSADGQTWVPLLQVPEVVPPELRGASHDEEQELLRERRDHRSQALVSLVVVLVLLTAAVGTVLWLDRNHGGGSDCSAPPGPGVNWQDCRFLGLAAPQADLRGLVLNNGAAPSARLSGADLAAADLRYVDLRGADLSYARLGAALLKGADLRDADLSYASLNQVDLSYADLRGARLGGADLEDVELSGALWIDGRRCPVGARGVCASPAADQSSPKLSVR